MSPAINFGVRSEAHVSLAINFGIRSEAHVSPAVDFLLRSGAHVSPNVDFKVCSGAHVSLRKNRMVPLQWSALGTQVKPKPMNTQEGTGRAEALKIRSWDRRGPHGVPWGGSGLPLVTQANPQAQDAQASGQQ